MQLDGDAQPRSSRHEVLLWAGASALLAAWLGWFASSDNWGLADDPYAAWFPAARELLNGRGLDALAPLHRGQARMPLYPLLIAAAGLGMPSLQSAAQLVNALAWSGAAFLTALTLLRLGWRHAVPFVFVGLAASDTVAHATADALPDALFALGLALLLLTLVQSYFDPRRRWHALAGLLASTMVLIRFNGIGVIFVPAGLALFGPAPRRRTLAHFVGGMLLGIAPLLALAAYLEAMGISYPNLYVKTSNLAGRLEVGAGSVLLSGLTGALGLPLRLSTSGTPLWVFAAALGGAAAGVWRHRERGLLRVLALTLAGLLAALVPMHHEPRYLVPFLPAFWAAAGVVVVAVASAAARHSGVQLRWLPAACAAAAFLMAVPPGIAATLGALANRVEYSRQMTAMCTALAGLGRGAPVAIAVPTEKFHYTPLRGCELHLGLPVAVLPAAACDRGVGYALRYDVDPKSSLVPIPTLLGSVAVVAAEASLAGRPATPDALGEPRRLELPRGVRRRGCGTTTIGAAGRETIALALSTPLTNALELSLANASGDRRGYLLWTGGAVQRFELPVPPGSGESVTASFCAANPIRADGDILFTLLDEPVH